MGPVRPRLLLTVLPAVLGAVLLAGCTTSVPGRATAAAVSSPGAATPAPSGGSPTAPATTTPAAPTTATAPDQVIEAGILVEGTGATVGGTGDALVTYGLGGGFAVVGTLDCSACAGPVQLTAPGRGTPLAEGTAPWTGQGLTGVTDDGSTTGEVAVFAEGSWTLQLSSWNDLPRVTGPQTVTGSAVLRFADEVPVFRVDFTPADAQDSFSGRVFSATDEGGSRVFGNTEAFTETYDVPLPGILAVQSRGTWTITPGG